MDNNTIYLVAIALATLIFTMLYKDPNVGPKYLSTMKKFIMIMLISAICYIYSPKIGLIIGFTSGYTGITNFDKDFSGRLILESAKIIIMQLLIGVAAYLCNFNQITTVIVSAIVIFLMYYFFTHSGKASRVRGFLLTYIILINEKVPKNDFRSVFAVLLLGIILSIAFYYFFTRDSYYKHTRILSSENFKKGFKFSNLLLEDDVEHTFRKNKFRHAIISTVLMTCAIFYMLYYGNPESEWIIIVASAILVIDPIMSERMIIDRTLGTIIGAIVFLVAHKFILSPAIIHILIFVSIFYFMFPMAYYKRMIFITYFALELHLMLSHQSAEYLVNYRIIFTIIAAIIVSIILTLDTKLSKLLSKNDKI